MINKAYTKVYVFLWYNLVGDIMREERDLYNSNLEKTNKTYFKGDIIPEGYYPMVVMIAIENSNGEFLMQKRSENKGGDWGVTGGHPKAGESPIEGIVTEVKEELGIDINPNEVIEFNSGCDGKDCYRMYYIKKDINLNDITIQEEELTEVKYFSMKELEEMVKNGELNENQVAFFKKCKNYLNK